MNMAHKDARRSSGRPLVYEIRDQPTEPLHNNNASFQALMKNAGFQQDGLHNREQDRASTPLPKIRIHALRAGLPSTSNEHQVIYMNSLRSLNNRMLKSHSGPQKAVHGDQNRNVEPLDFDLEMSPILKVARHRVKIKGNNHKHQHQSRNQQLKNIFAPRCRYNADHAVSSLRKLRDHEARCPNNPNRPF
mmetsp:Transcript_20569/g.35477  ORF Transcript_20569/g.35477 Transcript_20569/m.35477 type:complete len:190 (+) Transcript_20569:280-849(+)